MKNSSERVEEPIGVIIHSMGEYIGDEYCVDFLERIGLSAHFFITPDGMLVHGVDTNRVAYHAGKSQWQGQKNLNKNYIGIEIMVPGKHSYESFLNAIKNTDSFGEHVYETCSDVILDLMDIYPAIDLTRVVRHSEVSNSDVRSDPKKDPGSGFDMDKLKTMIDEFL